MHKIAGKNGTVQVNLFSCQTALYASKQKK
jgi:hypothetical protein